MSFEGDRRTFTVKDRRGADDVAARIAEGLGRRVMYGTGDSYPSTHVHVISGAFIHGERIVRVYAGSDSQLLGEELATIHVE